jgi:MSHA biogenesis protein MshQ
VDLEDLFVSTSGTIDLHLETCAPGAINTGLTLSFTDDIDAETRDVPWDIGADEHEGPPTEVNHFKILHDGTAVNCQAEDITITAHNCAHEILTNYTGAVDLSTVTSHGDWSVVTANGTLSNSGLGDGTYTFVAPDDGEVVLGLKDTYSETTNINLASGATTEYATEDPDLTYLPTGFNWLADSAKNTIGMQIAGKGSDVAPDTQTIELEAIRTNDETGACEAALQGANTIELGFECVDPTTCAGNNLVVNSTTVQGNSSGASPLSYTGVSLDFGDATDTTATLTLRYDDVGRIKLHARNQLLPSGEHMLGTSNEFVVRPFALDVSVSGNPAATGPTGGVLTTAGSVFTTTARAVLWEAADDADNDGQADGHGDVNPANNADLSDNTAAANFGQEAAAETLALASTLVEPSGGNEPGLSGTTTISSFTSGSGSSADTYFDEVGIIEISASVSDNDYLGIGGAETAKILGHSNYVGRFKPYDFDVSTNTPSFTTQCGAGNFTYVGETFDYSTAPVMTVTARSEQGTTTQNYTGSWFKLDNSSLTGRSYSAATGTLDTSGLPGTGSDPSIVDNGNGTGSLTFSAGSGLSFTRGDPADVFDAEIALGINVIDSDTVAYASNPASFGAATAGNGIAFNVDKEMRWGRLTFDNAHGSELVPLLVPFYTEYYDGTSFLMNTDDVCTALGTGDLTMTPDPGGLSSTPTIANSPLVLGDAGLSLTATGDGNTGHFDLEFDLTTATGTDKEWLFYDWDEDSSHDDNPTGRATFGIYAGEQVVIYTRELY